MASDWKHLLTMVPSLGFAFLYAMGLDSIQQETKVPPIWFHGGSIALIAIGFYQSVIVHKNKRYVTFLHWFWSYLGLLETLQLWKYH